MIGADRGGVHPVIGRHEQPIAGRKKLEHGGQRRDPPRQSPAAKPSTSLRCPQAMSKSTRLVKMSPSRPFLSRSSTTARFSSFEATLISSLIPLPAKIWLILPTAVTSTPRSVKQIEIGRTRRSEREVLAVRGARERSRWARERAGDDARHRMRTVQDLPRDRAVAVELLQRHHLDVAGDLEDAVRRRVDDGPPRDHVLPAELRDDLGARSSLVAQYVAPDPRAERTQHLFREAVGIHREGLGGDHSHVLPVAVGRVLARG